MDTARIRQPENHASIEFPIQQVRARFRRSPRRGQCSVCILTAMVTIAHGAQLRHKEAGFFAHDFGRALFQAVDGGVFTAVNVVAHLGFRRMARRMGGVGRVTVSLLKSIMLIRPR